MCKSKQEIVLLPTLSKTVFDFSPYKMVPVQFITQHTAATTHEQSALLALQGGCRWLQLSMKGATDDEIRPVAQRILAECRKVEATFVVEGHLELVKELKADGVFLGPDEMPIDEARNVLGHEFIIGGVANTFDEVANLRRRSADYVFCGPLRSGQAKVQAEPVLGMDGYRAIMERMSAEEVRIPVVAVGGVTLADVPALLSVGVSGVAVTVDALGTENPAEAMRALLSADE